MKKIALVLSIVLFLVLMSSCQKNGGSSNGGTYNGQVTELSKKFLSKGYSVNMTRSSVPLGDDAESYGKAYINMGFGILTEYVSTASYNPQADYNIKKVIVSNVKVLSTSKMGMVDDMYILERYSQSIADPHVKVIGTNSKYEIVNNPPHTTGVQSNIYVDLSKIALYDQTKSAAAANGNQPSLKEIYNELGITRDDVTLKIGFRVELITVSNKTLYKDYEITVPPANADITGSEFRFDFYETDTSKMQPFLEK